ncbi:acyltransferase family protein [Pseudomonas saliphila]|uniref:acyltransferase family protein n=1 Tax=Pseudomonas saliphila TaxID=2586906 RepID=UPI00123C2C44|nr:acyltransferase family protein [Pseudomonas saliphila]
MTKPHSDLLYRPDIDGLRAVAVLAVVIFHAFPAALPGGFIGVDIFFVISGYLISTIIYKSLQGERFSYADFYARRIRRIFPPLILMIATTLALGWHVLLPVEYAQLAKHSLGGFGFVANIVLWQETGYFDTAAEFKPLLHLWSLGVEEQFYLFWPVLAVAAWRLKCLGWLLIVLLAGSFLVNILSVGPSPAAAYFLLPARAWEMLAGAALAWVQFRHPARLLFSSRVATVLAALGITLIGAGLVLIDKHNAFPGWWALLPVGGAVCSIASGASNPINRYLLSNRFMVGIGLISFALYLWHWPLLSLLRIVKGDDASTWMLLSAVAVAFCLSWLSYKLIETPIRSKKGWVPVTALVSLCIVLMGASSNIFVRDGLNFRLKDAQTKLEARALEWPDRLKGDEACEGLLPAGMNLDCLIEDPAQQPSAMIIGDSHANHYYWGLAEQLKPFGLNLMQLAVGGCMPFYGVAVRDDGELDECREPMGQALDYALSASSVETIFLGGRWMSYVSGRELKDGVDHVSDALQLPDDPESGALDRQAVFSKAMRSTLDRLVQSGKQIVFMHAVPEMPFHTRECISWSPNRFVSRVPRESCAVDYAVTRERAGEYRPLLDELLAEYPTVNVFDPTPMLCDSERCDARVDGVLLYRDDDHLSLEGARWVGRQTAQQLKSILGRPEVDSLSVVR